MAKNEAQIGIQTALATPPRRIGAGICRVQKLSWLGIGQAFCCGVEDLAATKGD